MILWWQNLGMGGGVTAPLAYYRGADVLEAVYAWWIATSEVHFLASDRRLWQFESPQGALLPFAAFFLVSEMPTTWTTGFPVWTSRVQINCCASTDYEARHMGLTVRNRLEADGGRLIIDGSRVMHCLPAGSGLQVGKGFGTGGDDAWIAFEQFEIAWTPDPQ